MGADVGAESDRRTSADGTTEDQRARLIERAALWRSSRSRPARSLLISTSRRSQWFFLDEWDFLAGRDERPPPGARRALGLVPRLRLPGPLVGGRLRSYLPYAAMAIGITSPAGALLRVVMRRAGVSGCLS